MCLRIRGRAFAMVPSWRFPALLVLGSLFALVLIVALQASAWAQTLNLAGRDGKGPISIDAAGGIEWNQSQKLFIARGPAKATRGNLVLDADELRAYYREKPQGGSEIFRLDAIGHVRITQSGRVATGGRAVYDVDKSVVVLRDGNPVTMTSGTDVITARRQLEFWQARQLAVARGDAVATRGERRIRADVLTAQFATGADGQSRVKKIEAFDNVRITTAQDKVFADRGVYNVVSGLARLTGSVKIKRGANEISGCRADIDLKTGVSRMYSCRGAEVGAAVQTDRRSVQTGPSLKVRKPVRVHGVLSPKKKK